MRKLFLMLGMLLLASTSNGQQISEESQNQVFKELRIEQLQKLFERENWRYEEKPEHLELPKLDGIRFSIVNAGDNGVALIATFPNEDKQATLGEINEWNARKTTMAHALVVGNNNHQAVSFKLEPRGFMSAEHILKSIARWSTNAVNFKRQVLN